MQYICNFVPFSFKNYKNTTLKNKTKHLKIKKNIKTRFLNFNKNIKHVFFFIYALNHCDDDDDGDDNAKNYRVHLSTKYIKNQDAVLRKVILQVAMLLERQPNKQLSSCFAVAQTVRLLVVELMLVDDNST